LCVIIVFIDTQYKIAIFIYVLISCFRNIVCTVNLVCRLDLKKIALHARNAEYNPKRFAAVIMRIRDPRTTALIFSSGKMVCTGAKRWETVAVGDVLNVCYMF